VLCRLDEVLFTEVPIQPSFLRTEDDLVISQTRFLSVGVKIQEQVEFE
jgi:hypothetical protein